MFHQSHSYQPSPNSHDQVQVEAQVGAFDYHLDLQLYDQIMGSGLFHQSDFYHPPHDSHDQR